MVKKITELTLGEMGRICDKYVECNGCIFNNFDLKHGTDLCDIAAGFSNEPTGKNRLLDMFIELDEESDVQPEKNDSSANLEARIEKLEVDVNELMGRVFK